MIFISGLLIGASLGFIAGVFYGIKLSFAKMKKDFNKELEKMVKNDN